MVTVLVTSLVTMVTSLVAMVTIVKLAWLLW